MRLKEIMIYDIVTRILKMIIFSSSPRNQLPNHGLRAGAKSGSMPKTSTPASSSLLPPVQPSGNLATQAKPQISVKL